MDYRWLLPTLRLPLILPLSLDAVAATPMDPSTRSLRSLGRDDRFGRAVKLAGRKREEGVIPSEAEGGVEESVGNSWVDGWEFKIQH